MFLNFILLVIASFPLFAADSYYSSYSAAKSACENYAVNNGYVEGSRCLSASAYDLSVCGGDGYYDYARSKDYFSSPKPDGTIYPNVFKSCASGFSVCPGGAVRDQITGICETVCPSGTVKASTIPSLNTTLNTCVSPDAQRCTSIGVDVNSFIAKCSEMIEGAPASCLNNDMNDFTLQGCPQLKCADGSMTTYPTPCPVTSCEAGFTLSDVPGYGKTCIKPLPDKEPEKPCVNVQGSGDALCADPGRNCQQVNGSFVCIKEEVQPIPGATCYTINSKNYCLSNQPTLEVTKGTETLPDGSTRTTETYAPSVQGVNPSKRVTTIAPDGTSTTISNHPSDVAAAAGIASQGLKVDLSKVEKNTGDTATNTKTISDDLKAFFKTDDLGNPQDEQHAVLGDHSTLDDSILSAPQTDIGGLASPSSWWSLPNNQCYGSVDQQIFGFHFVLAPCDKLAPLREILAYFLYLTTAWQIFNIAFRTKEG